eukprot:UN19081
MDDVQIESDPGCLYSIFMDILSSFDLITEPSNVFESRTFEIRTNSGQREPLTDVDT